MFDFNLKPIPSETPTQARNLNSSATESSLNPLLVPLQPLSHDRNQPITSLHIDGFVFGGGTSIFNKQTIEEIKTVSYRNKDSYVDHDNDLILLLSGRRSYADEMKSLDTDVFSIMIPQESNLDIGLKIIIRGDATLHISLFDTFKNKLLLNSVFRQSDKFWIPIQGVGEIMQFENDPLSIGLALSLYYTVNALALNKEMAPETTKKENDVAILSRTNRCIDHDMICSIGGDGRTMLGVDVINCCIKHDIALWCSESGGSVYLMNQELFLCLIHKWVFGLSFPWNVLVAIVSVPALLLGAVVETVLTIFQAILTWFGIPDFTGLDKFLHPIAPYLGGGKGWSCLCGKGGDTFCCDPEKNPKYCKRKDGTLKNLCYDAECFNCYVECLRDDNGDFTGKKRNVDHPKLPCCFNTPPKGSEKIDCKKKLGNNHV